MKDTIIATITYDNNKDEIRKRIVKSVEEWKDLGLEVVTSDGGSSDELLSELRELDVNILLRHSIDVGVGIKQSVEWAAKDLDKMHSKILYCESDKSGNYGFKKDIEGIFKMLDRADIVVVGRTSDSMRSYPAFQQFTEKNLINRFYSDLIGDITGYYIQDFSYCTRAFRKSAAAYFTDCPYDNWAVMFESLIRAAKDGRKIVDRNVSITFPDTEEASSMKAYIYRIEQANQITLVPFLDYFKRNDVSSASSFLKKYSKLLQEYTTFTV